MAWHRFARGATTIAVLAAISMLNAGAWAAPHYKVLHIFGFGTGGGGLWGSLVLDGQGSLYGTTSGGGDFGYGTVFELTPGANGKWTHRLLHSFKNDDSDGAAPNSALIFDAAGDVFGTTSGGGGPYKHGTVFELEPEGGAGPRE